MKIIILAKSILIILGIYCSFTLEIKIKIRNPDITAGSSGGGDSGEFERKHQPMEHIFVPILNTVEGDYNPYFNTNIKIYRQNKLQLDKGIKTELAIIKENKGKISNDNTSEINSSVNKIFNV